MTKLHDILAYFCTKTESKSDLSKARITKLVYLADWFSAYESGQPMTDINWMFHHYGPYVNDVVAYAKNDPDFVVMSTYNDYGSFKEQIGLSDTDNVPAMNLTEDEEKILERILEKTSPLYFNQFIEYIYTTYPVKQSKRYDCMNLSKLAKEYKKNQQANLHTVPFAG